MVIVLPLNEIDRIKILMQKIFRLIKISKLFMLRFIPTLFLLIDFRIIVEESRLSLYKKNNYFDHKPCNNNLVQLTIKSATAKFMMNKFPIFFKFPSKIRDSITSRFPQTPATMIAIRYASSIYFLTPNSSKHRGFTDLLQ